MYMTIEDGLVATKMTRCFYLHALSRLTLGKTNFRQNQKRSASLGWRLNQFFIRMSLQLIKQYLAVHTWPEVLDFPMAWPRSFRVRQQPARSLLVNYIESQSTQNPFCVLPQSHSRNIPASDFFSARTMSFVHGDRSGTKFFTSRIVLD